MKKYIEKARLKKITNERSWSRKGVHYCIQQEYKIIDEYKNKYTINSLCDYMSVRKSEYYKWKY